MPLAGVLVRARSTAHGTGGLVGGWLRTAGQEEEFGVGVVGGLHEPLEVWRREVRLTHHSLRRGTGTAGVSVALDSERAKAAQERPAKCKSGLVGLLTAALLGADGGGWGLP